MASVLRIIVIDSNAESLGSVRHILAATPSVLVGEFCDIPQALREARTTRPDVVIVEIPSDQERKGESASAAIESLVRAFPDVAILVTGPARSAQHVIQVVRAGALDFLGRPVNPDDLLRALDKAARSRPSSSSPQRAGRVTSVFSTKGGVGVTTVATNLAICWATRSPKGTLLVDLDTRQSDIATFLHLRSSYSVVDAFENLERMDETFLERLLTKHPSGLFVLPGPPPTDRIKLSASQVQAGIEILRSHFDEIVLDLPHDVEPGTVAALEASDLILFLVSLNVSALRSGAAGLSTFGHLGVDPEKVRIVVMREGTGEDVTLKHACETLGMPIHWKTPSDYPTVVSAINSGKPVVTASSRSKIGKNLRQLSDLLANGQMAAEPSGRRAASLVRAMRSLIDF
jgi:pilus assembly protein CpaE